MFSGWGLRTLSSDNGGYNPISYHCGSVWPHDTAIVAAGLARYGYDGAAQQLIFGLLDAAAAQGGRLPELFSGLDRGELTVPVGYPTSCSPQAWSAASPLLCLRTLLRLDPWIPYGKTWLCPNLPEGIGYLKVEGIPLAGSRVTIEVGDRGARAGCRSAACRPRSRSSASPGAPRRPSERRPPAARRPAVRPGSPAPLDPLAEVRRLGADGGADAVAGQDQRVGRRTARTAGPRSSG